MTKALPPAGGANPLANVLKGNASDISGLQSNLYNVIIDKDDPNGSAVVIEGPDISAAPANTFKKLPTMELTGLTGSGIAYKTSATTWAKLNWSTLGG